MGKNRRWDFLGRLGFGRKVSRKEGTGAKRVSRRPLRMEHLEDRQLLSVSGSIGGSVYYDLDQDGTRDPAEVGLPDWTVELQKIGDEELASLLETIGDPSLQSSRRFATSVAAHEVAQGQIHLFIASPNSQPGMILRYDTSGNLLETILDPVPGGSFGSSLAIVGNTLLVGDPDETVDEYLQAGAVYAFNLTTGSLQATYHKRDALDQDAPAEGDLFGFSLAGLSGEFVVGAPGDDLSGTQDVPVTTTGLTLDQIKSTWNYKHGRMAGIQLPEELAKALEKEARATEEEPAAGESGEKTEGNE